MKIFVYKVRINGFIPPTTSLLTRPATPPQKEIEHFTEKLCLIFSLKEYLQVWINSFRLVRNKCLWDVDVDFASGQEVAGFDLPITGVVDIDVAERDVFHCHWKQHTIIGYGTCTEKVKSYGGVI